VDSVQILSCESYSLLSYYEIGDLASFAVSSLDTQLAYGTSDGTVAVAPNPYYSSDSVASVAVNPTEIIGGAGSTGILTLSQPAPTGGVTVLLKAGSSCTTVPAAITVLAGASQATFPIATTSVASSVNVVITASTGGAIATASLVVDPCPVRVLTLSPSTVVSGNSSTGTLTLSQPASAGGTIVSLSSSDPTATVPETITVAAGSTTATFAVRTVGVDVEKVLVITAGSSDASQSAMLTVLPASLASISLNPATVISGSSSVGTVGPSGIAGPSGVVIALTCSNTHANVPGSVTVSPGQTSAQFMISTTTSTVNTSATITASLGTVSLSATLALTRWTQSLSSLSLSPASVAAGQNATGKISLNSPAGASGILVSLLSQMPSYVGVPASCLVPAGATSASFPITTTARPLPYTNLITATLGSTSQSATLMVTSGYALSSLTLNPSTVTAGGTSSGTVFLGGAAPSGGWVVNLSAGNPSLIGLPSTVTVPAGAMSAAFVISEKAIATSFISTIKAQDGFASKSASLSVTGEGITGLSVTPNSISGGGFPALTISLKAKAPNSGWLVHLSAGVPSAVSVPSTVTVPSGSDKATVYLPTSHLTKTITTAIDATDANTGANTTLTVFGDSISHLSVSPTTLGSGGIANGTVTLTSPAPSGGWPVILTATPQLVTTPGNVTVPAGSTSAVFTITGKATSTTTKCVIVASDGLTSSSASVTIAGDRISSLKLSPTTIGTNDSSTGTVTLKSAAPSGGWLVKISSSDPSLVIVQTAVIVPAGAESAKFEITAKPTASTTTVTIDVSDGNSSASATLKVDGDSILSLSLSPSSVVGGANSTGTVKLKSAAPPGGWPVKLTSANASVVSVPQSVLVPAGSSSVSFKVTTAKVTKTTGIEISASDGVSTGTATLTVKP